MESKITELKKAIIAEYEKAAGSETELENLLRDLQARKIRAENAYTAFVAMEYIQLLDAETEKYEAALAAKRAARKEKRGDHNEGKRDRGSFGAISAGRSV